MDAAQGPSGKANLQALEKQMRRIEKSFQKISLADPESITRLKEATTTLKTQALADVEFREASMGVESLKGGMLSSVLTRSFAKGNPKKLARAGAVVKAAQAMLGKLEPSETERIMQEGLSEFAEPSAILSEPPPPPATASAGPAKAPKPPPTKYQFELGKAGETYGVRDANGTTIAGIHHHEPYTKGAELAVKKTAENYENIGLPKTIHTFSTPPNIERMTVINEREIHLPKGLSARKYNKGRELVANGILSGKGISKKEGYALAESLGGVVFAQKGRMWTKAMLASEDPSFVANPNDENQFSEVLYLNTSGLNFRGDTSSGCIPCDPNMKIPKIKKYYQKTARASIEAAAKNQSQVLCYNIGLGDGFFGGKHQGTIRTIQREAIINEFAKFKKANPDSRLKLHISTRTDKQWKGEKKIIDDRAQGLGLGRDIYTSDGVDKDKAAAYYAEQGLSVAVTVASDPLVMLGPLGPGLWVEGAPYASDEERQASYCFDREVFNAGWDAWQLTDASGRSQKVVPAQFMTAAADPMAAFDDTITTSASAREHMGSLAEAAGMQPGEFSKRMKEIHDRQQPKTESSTKGKTPSVVSLGEASRDSLNLPDPPSHIPPAAPSRASLVLEDNFLQDQLTILENQAKLTPDKRDEKLEALGKTYNKSKLSLQNQESQTQSALPASAPETKQPEALEALTQDATEATSTIRGQMHELDVSYNLAQNKIHEKFKGEPTRIEQEESDLHAAYQDKKRDLDVKLQEIHHNLQQQANRLVDAAAVKPQAPVKKGSHPKAAAPLRAASTRAQAPEAAAEGAAMPDTRDIATIVEAFDELSPIYKSGIISKKVQMEQLELFNEEVDAKIQQYYSDPNDPQQFQNLKTSLDLKNEIGEQLRELQNPLLTTPKPVTEEDIRAQMEKTRLDPKKAAFSNLETLARMKESRKKFVTERGGKLGKLPPKTKLRRLEKATMEFAPQLQLYEKYKRLEAACDMDIESLDHFRELESDLKKLENDIDTQMTGADDIQYEQLSEMEQIVANLREAIEKKTAEKFQKQIEEDAQPLIDALAAEEVSSAVILDKLFQGKTVLEQNMYIEILEKKGYISPIEAQIPKAEISLGQGFKGLAQKLFSPDQLLQKQISPELQQLDEILPRKGKTIGKMVQNRFAHSGMIGVKKYLQTQKTRAEAARDQGKRAVETTEALIESGSTPEALVREIERQKARGVRQSSATELEDTLKRYKQKITQSNLHPRKKSEILNRIRQLKENIPKLSLLEQEINQTQAKLEKVGLSKKQTAALKKVMNQEQKRLQKAGLSKQQTAALMKIKLQAEDLSQEQIEVFIELEGLQQNLASSGLALAPRDKEIFQAQIEATKGAMKLAKNPKKIIASRKAEITKFEALARTYGSMLLKIEPAPGSVLTKSFKTFTSTTQKLQENYTTDLQELNPKDPNYRQKLTQLKQKHTADMLAPVGFYKRLQAELKKESTSLTSSTQEIRKNYAVAQRELNPRAPEYKINLAKLKNETAAALETNRLASLRLLRASHAAEASMLPPVNPEGGGALRSRKSSGAETPASRLRTHSAPVKKGAPASHLRTHSAPVKKGAPASRLRSSTVSSPAGKKGLPPASRSRKSSGAEASAPSPKLSVEQDAQTLLGLSKRDQMKYMKTLQKEIAAFEKKNPTTRLAFDTATKDIKHRLNVLEAAMNPLRSATGEQQKFQENYKQRSEDLKQVYNDKLQELHDKKDNPCKISHKDFVNLL